jgi:hypothetical protein
MAGGTSITKASPAFLITRMAAAGTLVPFLDERCPQEGWTLCEYRDTIPEKHMSFLWDENFPAFKNTGGVYGDTALRQFREIIRAQLTSPKWLAANLFRGAEATAVQLVRVHFEEFLFSNLGLACDYWLKAYYRYSYPHFRVAKQQQGTLPLAQWNVLQDVAVLIALGILMWVLAKSWKLAIYGEALLPLLTVIGVGILLNATVCGVLAGTDNRYGARLIFLVTLITSAALSNKDVQRAILPHSTK